MGGGGEAAPARCNTSAFLFVFFLDDAFLFADRYRNRHPLRAARRGGTAAGTSGIS
jgi:hypothetical protein